VGGGILSILSDRTQTPDPKLLDQMSWEVAIRLKNKLLILRHDSPLTQNCRNILNNCIYRDFVIFMVGAWNTKWCWKCCLKIDSYILGFVKNIQIFLPKVSGNFRLKFWRKFRCSNTTGTVCYYLCRAMLLIQSHCNLDSIPTPS